MGIARYPSLQRLLVDVKRRDRRGMSRLPRALAGGAARVEFLAFDETVVLGTLTHVSSQYNGALFLALFSHSALQFFPSPFREITNADARLTLLTIAGKRGVVVSDRPKQRIMGQEDSPELLEAAEAPVLPVLETMTNSAVDEVASQGLDVGNGPTSKWKRDDVEAPGSELEGKEASDLGGGVAPVETHGEELAAASTEVGEGVADKTKESLTDSSTENTGTKSEQIHETVPMAVEREAEERSTGENEEEKDLSEQSEMKQVAEGGGEKEGEVKEGVPGNKPSGTANGNGVEHFAERSGEENGKETEAVETRKFGVEENGNKKTHTDPSLQGKSVTGEDKVGALDTSPPNAKRRKSEGRSVASTAAKNEKTPGKPPCDPQRLELLKKMNTVEDMKKLVAEHGKSEADYIVGDIIKVDDLMQTDYNYKLEAPVGKNFAEGFSPAFTPQEMLAYGVFEGKVINDCIFEFPKEWYEEAIEKGKLSPEGPDDAKNYFRVKSRLPSKQWRKRGWFPKEDPHGWFQWYCRYYMGRRLEPDDTHQISRWRQLRRHAGQIKKNCRPGDLSNRIKQRQTLLNWSHDCFM